MSFSRRQEGGAAGRREGSDTRRAGGELKENVDANHVENMGFETSCAAPRTIAKSDSPWPLWAWNRNSSNRFSEMCFKDLLCNMWRF